VAASFQSVQGTRDSFSFPDGKQTRIDFFETGKRSSRDWWHALTGWLRASRHEQEDRLEEYRKFLEARKYSPKTCQSYIFMLRKFFRHLDEKGITQITFDDIEDYNYAFFVSGKYSRSYQLQFINGLSLYMEYARGVRVNLKGLQRSEARR
jgi:hypothetical protein